MEYKIGTDGLAFKTQEDGHGDFVRGDVVLLCLNESETKSILRLVIDAESMRAEREEKNEQ